MTKKIPITLARGDGIGPEISQATLTVFEALNAPLEIHEVEIGEKVYRKGIPTCISPESWETILNTKAFLKAPITTPQGGGFKSLNVTIRTTLGLYANIRPCVSYAPYIETLHPKMDVVIVRENEEDLYTGIEYQQTPETVHALKIITRPGCTRIIQYAFEYAEANNRKKVTCFTKDNILKMSDGLFHKIFDEIAPQYPNLENEHWIIDIGSAKLADTPEAFDVIVVPNLYGDILSDVAAQIAGSVGLVGSANIGLHGAMFEAIHGSAPRRAGMDVANPSGFMHGAIMMLAHIGLTSEAELFHNAWLKTIEDGIHTYDIFTPEVSKKKVGTKEFGKAVAARLGQKPSTLKPAEYNRPIKISQNLRPAASMAGTKELVGVDVFIESNGSVKELHQALTKVEHPLFSLKMIANRGVRVWPSDMPETYNGDTWRCRFLGRKNKKKLSGRDIVQLLESLANAQIDFLKTEHLYTFDGVPGYTVSQEQQ